MQFIKKSTFLIASIGLFAGHFSLASPQLSQGSVNTINGSITGNNTSNVVVGLDGLTSVLNWDSFNTEQLEKVTFNMRVGGKVLNFINDSGRTVFNGFLSANNGSVFLVNPNGIEFGAGSSVTVLNGSFVASSLTISADDFENNNYQFTTGSSKGVVINRGTILASHVGLIGNSVVNQGFVNAISFSGESSVNLIAGEAATLTFDSAGLMQFEITEAVTENLADPASNNNAIEHSSGRISANQVLLSAKTAAGVFDNAINSQGRLEATRINNQGGIVRLRSEGALTGEDINVDLDRVASSVETIIVSIPTVTPAPQPDGGNNLPVNPPSPPSGGDGDGVTPLPQPEPEQDQNIASANLNTLNANSNNPGNNTNIAASAAISLGLFSVESSGIRLPADQQEEF